MTDTKHTPRAVVQVTRMGRGYAVTRNSAVLCTTDYLHIATEIMTALNRDAAAPELLEACRRFVDYVDALQEPDDDDSAMANQARAAIAKATGK